MLIQFLSMAAPSANIIVSAILPRPKDFDRLGEKVKVLNHWLQDILPCMFPEITVIRSFSWVLKEEHPGNNFSIKMVYT